MKYFSFKPLREWFGFSRRERRSSFILLIIIALVAGARFIVPSKKIPVEFVTLEIPDKVTDGIKHEPQAMRSKPIAGKGQNEVSYQVIELNSCDSSLLETLPGIGPVLSARIIKYRNLLGGFADKDQLKEVYGLSAETFSLISNRVKADPSMIRKININSAEYKQLVRLPYFEKGEAAGILKYREGRGRIEAMSDLVDNKIITEEKAVKVKWYLDFK